MQLHDVACVFLSARRSETPCACGSTGSTNTVLCVYDVAKKCSIPLELGDDKMMPTAVALTENGAIVGKRAEARSAKRCNDVLCAYRHMLFGIEDVWASRRTACEEGWQFQVVPDEEGDRGYAWGGAYHLRGEKVAVSTMMEHVLRAVCSQLLDAAKPGGPLLLAEGDEPSWLSFVVGVPECFSAQQRELVEACAARVTGSLLGGGVKVVIVNDSLAAAMQYISLPPYDADRRFMIVDIGASHLTTSIFDYVCSEEGAELKELSSNTNVFVGGDEMVHRLMLWCERRKPFNDSMLSSKTAVFKLRKELRGAIKTLTVAEEAMIEVDSVLPGHDLALMLTLEDFERECSDLFAAVTDSVHLALESARTGGFPTEVVLVSDARKIHHACLHAVREAACVGDDPPRILATDMSRMSAGGAHGRSITRSSHPGDPAAIARGHGQQGAAQKNSGSRPRHRNGFGDARGFARRWHRCTTCPVAREQPLLPARRTPAICRGPVPTGGRGDRCRGKIVTRGKQDRDGCAYFSLA